MLSKRVQKLAHRIVKKVKKELQRDPPKVTEVIGETRDPTALERHDSFTECRKCLEPGIARDCCGNFYCNECFYRFASCPSCEKQIDRGDFSTIAPKSTEGMRKLSMCGVLCFYLLVMATIPAYYFWKSRIPITIFNHECSGVLWHEREWLCINRDDFLYKGDTRFQNWRRCTNGSEVGCVCGHACMTNRCLYEYNNGATGVDIVRDTFLPAEIVMQEEFPQGLTPGYWRNVTGHAISNACGTVTGNQTLRFRGPNSRFAITRDFDLRYGGELEFYLIYGSGQAQGCASLELGVATVDYSTDFGATWRELRTYERNKYRQPNFTHVRELLPANATSTHTRFRWYQKHFWEDFDVFAIDAIKVFQYLEPEWEDTATFVAFKEAMRVQELEDSCCMDCNTCENPHEIERPDECKALPGFMGLPVHTAMEQELMILGAGILAGMHLAMQLYIVFRRTVLLVCLRCWSRCLPPTFDDATRRKHRRWLAEDPPRRYRWGDMDSRVPTIGSRHSVNSNPRTVIEESDDDKTTVADSIRPSGLTLPSSFTDLGSLPGGSVTGQGKNSNSKSKSKSKFKGGSGSVQQVSRSSAAKRQANLHERLERASAIRDQASTTLPGAPGRNRLTAVDSDGDDFVLEGGPSSAFGGQGSVVSGHGSSIPPLSLPGGASVSDQPSLSELEAGEGNYSDVENEDAKAVAAPKRRRKRGKGKRGKRKSQAKASFRPVAGLGSDDDADAGAEADDEAPNPERTSLASVLFDDDDDDADDDGDDDGDDSSDASPAASVDEDFGNSFEDQEELERPKSALSRLSRTLSRLSKRSHKKSNDGGSTARSLAAASIATPYRVSESSSTETDNAMSEDERAEKGMETIKFKTYHGKTWHLVYLVLGVGLPGVLGFIMIGLLLNRTSDFIRLEFGIYDYDTAYAWITFAGIMSDANTVLHVASEVVGLSPATVTSFRVERPHRENSSDLMDWLRRSRLVVDRGIGRVPYRVDLDNVSFVREAFNVEGYMICTLYLITSQPTSLFGLLLSPKHRLWAVALALFSLFKIVYGPGFLLKIVLIVNQMNGQIYAAKSKKRENFAGSCCAWRCRQGGLLIGCKLICWGIVGIGIYMLGVLFLPRAEHFRRHLPEMIGILSAALIIASCVLGCILGCTHTLPVHPIVALTAAKKGVLVYFTIPRQSEMFEHHRVCAGDPEKIPGTGSCVPFKDYFSHKFGLLPDDQPHFDVDPFPRQEAVLYCYVRNYKEFLQNVDIAAILERLRNEADERQRRELTEAAEGYGDNIDAEIAVLETILTKARTGRVDDTGHKVLRVVADRKEVRAPACMSTKPMRRRCRGRTCTCAHSYAHRCVPDATLAYDPYHRKKWRKKKGYKTVADPAHDDARHLRRVVAKSLKKHHLPDPSAPPGFTPFARVHPKKLPERHRSKRRDAVGPRG